MKIKYNNSGIEFHELANGDLFRMEGDTLIYIKVKQVTFDGSYYLNSVCLEDGDFEHFKDDDDVQRVNAHLVVEN